MNSSKQILDSLTELLSGNFDVRKNVSLNERHVPLLAKSKLNIRHYAVSKKIVLDEFRMNDYLFCFLEQGAVSKQRFDETAGWVHHVASEEIKQQDQHLRSRFIGLIIGERQPEDQNLLKYFTKHYKFHWIKFGLKGWYELFMILYFTDTYTWLIPKKGKDFIPLLKKLTHTLTVS